MNRLAQLLVLVAFPCWADPVFKNAGGTLGPVTSINCMSDGGILCARDAGMVGTLKCNAATAIEPGCVVPGAQALGTGDKTFGGKVITPILDAGVGAIGSLDLRGSSLANRDSSSTFTISSNTADSTTTSTVAALKLQCSASITSTDLCLDVQDSSGNHRLGVQAGGTLNFSAQTTTSGVTAGSNATAFTATLGAGAGGDGANVPGNGASWTVTGGKGGDTSTVDGFGTAGRGGDMTLAAGAGGADLGAVSGGPGGQMIISAGAAGPGQSAGSVSVTAGVGGAASTLHVSGGGGVIAVAGGQGGASASGNAASQGGNITLTAGKGGTDTINAGAGQGGSLTLRSGGGGTLGSGTGGASGDVTIDTGTATGAASAGTINIGAANAGAMNVGRSGKTVTFAGTINSTGTLATTGNVGFGTNGTSFTTSKSVASSIDFPSILAQTCNDQTLAGLTDCSTDDVVACSFSSTLTTGIAPSCFMSASATVTFRMCNVTASPIDMASKSFGARCWH